MRTRPFRVDLFVAVAALLGRREGARGRFRFTGREDRRHGPARDAEDDDAKQFIAAVQQIFDVGLREYEARAAFEI